MWMSLILHLKRFGEILAFYNKSYAVNGFRQNESSTS